MGQKQSGTRRQIIVIIIIIVITVTVTVINVSVSFSGFHVMIIIQSEIPALKAEPTPEHVM